MKEYLLKIAEMRACREALEFLGGFETLDEAWQKCEQGDWMLWLAGKLSGEPMSDTRKPLVLAACECARLALLFTKKGEERPLRAIELAEKWAHGDSSITLDELRKADAAAAYIADAAAYAAYSAAADAAADAAAYVAAYARRKAVLKQCASIVRKYYPIAPELGYPMPKRMQAR
jgi:hypothetical protein